jgi:hypothetical protein
VEIRGKARRGLVNRKRTLPHEDDYGARKTRRSAACTRFKAFRQRLYIFPHFAPIFSLHSWLFVPVSFLLSLPLVDFYLTSPFDINAARRSFARVSVDEHGGTGFSICNMQSAAPGNLPRGTRGIGGKTWRDLFSSRKWATKNLLLANYARASFSCPVHAD